MEKEHRINVKCHVSHHISSHFIVKRIYNNASNYDVCQSILSLGTIWSMKVTCFLEVTAKENIANALTHHDIVIESSILILWYVDNKIKMGKLIKNSCFSKYTFAKYIVQHEQTAAIEQREIHVCA